MTNLVTPIPQGDGTPLQWSNCGCAVCAELIGLASVDALHVEARQVRARSGDTEGGIEGADLARTATLLTRGAFPIEYRRFVDRAELVETLRRSSIGIMIYCGVTVDTPYRTNGFTGRHWWTVAAGTHKDGTDKVEDPGTTRAGWMRVPRRLLLAAAWKVNDNGYWTLVSPPTEDVDKRALVQVTVRAEPDVTSKRLGRLDAGDGVHVIRTTRAARIAAVTERLAAAGT